MQIVLARTDLVNVLKRVSVAVDTGGMLAVRRAVLIVAEPDPGGGPSRVTFGATNGPLEMVCKAPGEIKARGRALLDYRALASRVSELPEGYIEVSVSSDYKVTLRSGASKRKLTMTGLVPEDFPNLLAEKPGEALYRVNAKILQQAAGEVRFGVNRDRIDGALLAPGEAGMFELVSIGNHAMVIAKGWFVEGSVREQRDCLLPSNLMDAVQALSPASDLAVSMDDTKIFIETADALVMAARLHTGFVEAWRIALESMPTEKRFRTSSEAFLGSVKAVSSAADYLEGVEKFIQIDVACLDGVVTLSTRKSDRSQGDDELAVSDAAPGAFRFHVDGQLLSHALRAFLPVEVDVYYDGINGQPMLCLKSETLVAFVSLIAEVEGPGKK